MQTRAVFQEIFDRILNHHRTTVIGLTIAGFTILYWMGISLNEKVLITLLGMLGTILGLFSKDE